jgi:uncharacterized protein YuzE
MRITYDPKYDAVYLKFGEVGKVLCREIDEDITFDLDAQGRLVSMEILSASEHINLSQLLPVEITKELVK